METKQEKSLQGQVNKLKGVVKDILGQGFWGLKKDSEKFTHEEIVFLFARIFPVFGVDYIKEVRTEFPDCICVEEGRQIGIEFEPALSSFKDHLKKDDLSKCQYVVCWKDDLDLSHPMRAEIEKNSIGVLELKQVYDQGKVKDRRTPVVVNQALINRLAENQLKILKAFIDTGNDLLTKDEIEKAIGLYGKPLGGPLGGLTSLVKGMDDWIIRKRPDRVTWEFNKRHEDKIIVTLKKFGI